MTWGRIHDNVDPTEVEALVLAASPGFSLRGTPVSARACLTLQEARDQPYFYECLASLTAELAVSLGVKDWDTWRKRTAKRMARGKEIYYLGHPSPTPPA